MYSNIDIEIVVNHILEIIYLNPENFFTEFEESENGDQTLKIIPKKILKEFFTKTLTKFSSFSTLNGYFRQSSGLSMGGKLSSPLSNIFMNIMEQKIIKKYIAKGDIIYYTRYVDDTLVCAKKGAKNDIFSEINNFHKDIEFTECEMENNGGLTFLDMNLYFDNQNILQTKLYRKSEKIVYNNFRQAIMPKSQKISTLVGEIHRINHCSSNNRDLAKSLGDLEKAFLKNEYPKSLVENKIREINQIKISELFTEIQ